MQQKGRRMTMYVASGFYKRVDYFGKLVFDCSKTGSDKFFRVKLQIDNSDQILKFCH